MVNRKTSQPWLRHLTQSALAIAASTAVCSALAQTTLPAVPPVSPATVVDLEYDAEGQPTKTIVDKASLAVTSRQHYNALGQLDQSTNAKTGLTQLEYDALGRLTKVTDPLGLITSYPRNGLGDPQQLISPDTGTTTNSVYDGAGNLTDWTDSRGVRAVASFDALNRLTQLVYSKGFSEGYSWTYDQTGTAYGAGIGHLTSTGTPVGISTAYQYDNKGRLTRQSQTVPTLVNTAVVNLTHSVGYGYNGADRLTSIVYPSGRKVGLNYAAGSMQPTSITILPTATSTATPTTVLGAISWLPFGAARSWNWGGQTSQPHVRSFDDSGRMTRYPLGLHTRDVLYDSAGRISDYKHYLTSSGAATPALNQSFLYDANGQLTNINLYATGWVISYDGNGNRSSVTIGATTRVYGTEVVSGTTTPKSNRLKTLSNPAATLSQTEAGSLLADETRSSYIYYLNNRMTTATLAGGSKAGGYRYDANGQRVRKFTQNLVNGSWVVDETTQIHFVYDPAGHLLGEYDKTGAALREYIWLDDIPVAMFTPGTTADPVLYYIDTDHLNTPRAVMNTAGQLRWRWIADPFGTAVPETNPSNLGAFVQNLRMPGQYADSETGLFYNTLRDYDPMVGRYIESDPIGLGGGINTYSYVGGNPISRSDPSGLCPLPLCPLLVVGLIANEIANSDVPIVGGSVAKAGGEAAAELAAKATAIHGSLDQIAQSMRTTAVLRTNTCDIVAGGARDLTRAQKAVAQSVGATPAALPGAHAEVTAITNAQEQGLLPKLLEVTRNICPSCASFIESTGGTVTGPRSAKW